MAYITFDQARRWSRQAWRTRSAAANEIKKSAAAPSWTRFDVFMSHSFKDAEVIAGLKLLLERSGLSVYVDWIDDAQLDRSQVTTETAGTLRQRMKNCSFLLYATSESSPNSKWMPWELGYFDGLNDSEMVGIMPIVESADDDFKGQEYLGLYRSYELIDFTKIGAQVGRMTGLYRGETLKSDVRRVLR